MDDVLTIEELSDWLRVHRTSLYRWIKADEIPYFRVGDVYRFNRAAIEKWMENHGTPQVRTEGDR